MRKNILFYFAWQLKPVHFSIIIHKLDEILAVKDDETKIYFLVCNGILKPCYSNKGADPALCNMCRFNNSIGLKKYRDKIEILKISEYASSNFENFVFDYNTVEDIKKIVYKDVSIGYGALSSYISSTRNLEPIFNDDFKRYFDKLVTSQVLLTDAILEIMDSKNIWECYFFNGRTADTRPVYDICVNKKINFTSLELVKENDSSFYVNEFFNCLPHDINFHHHRILANWENDSVSLTEKIRIGETFFKNRKLGNLVGDRMVYTKSQEFGRLPLGFNNSKKNITIFVSSEDEFASIGDVFESKSIFKTQEQGIIDIVSHYKLKEGNTHFYIRLHPNLSEVKYSYHSRLTSLGNNYANLTVISATSKVSTYSLIDHSDIIITFGSSTGVEACFWEKPVILLAGSFYYFLDVSYKPKNKEELFNLIDRKELVPKSKIEAIKYGYYIVSYKNYTTSNTLNPKPINIFNKELGFKHEHLKILGSSTLYRIIERIYYIINMKFLSKKIIVPNKGK